MMKRYAFIFVIIIIIIIIFFLLLYSVVFISNELF